MACCCGGCYSAPGGPLSNDADRNTNVWPRVLCCSCIPLALCVTLQQYDTSRTSVAWRYCGTAPYDEGPHRVTVYSVQFTINGELTTVYFKFVTDLEYETCQFCCVLGDNLAEQCILIDKTERTPDDPYCERPCNMRIAFCCDMAAEFTLDASGIGTGENATVTISTGVLDLVSLGKCRGLCRGCNCICRCACMTVSGDQGGAADSAVVCAELDYYGNPSWTLGDYTVTLRGREPSRINSFTLTAGTVVGGDEFDVMTKDNVFHRIDAAAGQIDAEYEIDIGTRADADYATRLLWYGNVTAAGSTVLLHLWNWTTSDWVQVCTISGEDQTTYQRVRDLDLGTLPQYTGTGLNVGKLRVRFTSEDATQLATDYIQIVAPNCCKLWINGQHPIAVVYPNDCPTPTASWLLTTASGTTFVRWECADCGGDCPTVTDCCPNGVPKSLNLTITDSSCPEFIGVTFSMIWKSAAEGGTNEWEWTGTHPTLPLTFIRIGCSGGVWTLTSDLCAGVSAESYSAECDPLLVQFNALITLLSCCPSDPFASFTTLTLELTL